MILPPYFVDGISAQDAVGDFNKSIKTFPNNMLAGMFGFNPREFFEAEEGSREVPEVDFTG